MIVLNPTDTSLAAIEKHVERQLAHSDIITLTRAQALALLSMATRVEPVNV